MNYSRSVFVDAPAFLFESTAFRQGHTLCLAVAIEFVAGYAVDTEANDLREEIGSVFFIKFSGFTHNFFITVSSVNNG